jgi:hypothetical protein
MSLQLQPVQVATASSDTEGQLVLAGEFLVAVLVRLSDEHGAQAGKWFLEQGFGRVDHASPPLFADLDEVQAWIAWRLSSPR